MTKVVLKCPSCGHMIDFGPNWVPVDLSKPKTNADRIRSMTDEELAYRLAINECGICPLKEKCFAMQPIKDCEDMWLDWLQQPATE